MLTSNLYIVQYVLPAILVLASPTSVRGQEGTGQERTISVNLSRPLYQAMRQLRTRYGWLISYQDPPYEHPDDLMLREGAPARHLIPRRMNITVGYTEPRAGDLEGQFRTIERIVDRFNASGTGQFRVVHRGAYSYVVPVSVKRASGVVENLPSLCEVTVSLPAGVRTMYETLGLILPRLSQHLRAPIIRGAQPTNLFLGNRYPSEAEDQSVCDVLVGTFDAANVARIAIGAPPIHVVWALLYDATDKTYAFNAQLMDQLQSPPPYVGVAPQEKDK